MINLRNLATESRVFAAGLCGAAVLALTVMSSDVATAQDEPTTPDEPNTKQNAENMDKDQEELDETQEMTSKLDISEISFDANVVKTLGDSQALIVERSGQEYLVPVQALQSEQESNSENEDSWNDSSEQTAMSSDENSNTQYDMTSNNSDEPADSEQSDAASADEPAQNDEKKWKEGDQVTVSPNLTDAELVALENNVLTLRGEGTVAQMPADLIPKQDTEFMNLTVTIDGEKQSMTLSEAIEQERELTLSHQWPTELPTAANAGVLVATEPDRMIVATVGEKAIEIVQIPQNMQAGQAVSLEEDQDDVEIQPLDQTKMVSFEESKITGNLLSSNDKHMFLESGDELLILPGSLSVESNSDQPVEKGTEVTVTLPAGEAQVMDEHNNVAVMEIEQGLAHLPMDALNMKNDSNSG